MPDAPWAALLRALPDALRDDLRPGASETALADAERALGLALPADVRAVYAAHDGQAGDAPGALGGLRFLPLADVAAEHAKWADVLATSPDLAGLPVEAVPAGAVAATTWDARWVPVADDGAGNGLAVDLAAGPVGTQGQVVTVGADEPTRRVLAPSLPALLDRLAALFASGDLAVDGGDVRLRDGRDLLTAAPDVFGS